MLRVIVHIHPGLGTSLVRLRYGNYIDRFCRISIFSERSLFAVAHPSVCLSSVTFVRPTQAVQIFSNIPMALGTLAIR